MTQLSEAALMGRDSLLNRLEDYLKLASSEAGDIELTLENEHVAVTRYAHNRIHQNVSSQDMRLMVRVLKNGALASLTCNSLEPSAVLETIARAATIARRLPDRSHPGFAQDSSASGSNIEPGAEDLPAPAWQGEPGVSFVENTAGQTPGQRAEAISRIVEPVAAAGYTAYGTYKTTRSELVVANSLGLRAYAAGTAAYVKTLVESTDGRQAGFADWLGRDASQLQPTDLAHIAIEKCRLNHDQIELPPNNYAAVLEPNAVADLVLFMAQHGCGAQHLQEGRSFMTGRLGERVTGANINLWEDPGHPGAMPFPLDFEGQQTRAVPLVIGGRAAGVVYDRPNAARAPGHVSTGHALNPWTSFTNNGPFPQHLVMQAGSRPVSELVKDMKRGLLITRLHYTHCPDPRRVIATGTTRDGTFLVENGEIVAAVKNMRLTQSVLELLAGVEEFSLPKTCQDWWCANGMVGNINYYLPGVRVGRVTFTGQTTF